jgi:hypothetical protein
LLHYKWPDREENDRHYSLSLPDNGGESWKKDYRILAPTGRLGMFGISAAATRKERSMLAMLSLLATIAWFQFNPLSLMNANKGVFGVNQGHMWGEINRMRGWADQLLDLRRQGRHPIFFPILASAR